MKPSGHTIELNGKRYDAMTGTLLGDASRQARTQSVDGFVKVSLPAAKAHLPHNARLHASHTASAGHIVAPAPKSFDINRSVPHHARPHQLQHSKTLMRSAVHRPEVPFKRVAKPVAHTGTVSRISPIDIVPKHSASIVDEDRYKRARRIAKSRLISRFANVQVHPSAQLPAAPTQAEQSAPAPLPTRSRQPSDDIFERALATANSHKQPYAPVKKRKKTHRLRTFTGVLASSVAILMIVGFVAYQNASFIQLRVASSRSGINATLPSWQPSGFKLGAFAYGPGTVTVNYNNLAANTSFKITQVASNWDSATLLSDYVYPSNETYNTLSSAGNTIYTYGNNNATWVSGGIWYRLTSDGSLSNSQIVNIATSM